GGLNLSSGTNLNGTWTETFTVPQFVEPGTWTIGQMTLVDNVGNYKYYYQSDLQALGYPTTLQVIDGISVALASGTNPSTYNQSVTFTATVTSGTTTVATGTVNFLDGTTTIGSGTLNASGVATFTTTSALSVGPHSMVADYLGDANNPPENSAALTQTVNPAASVVAVSSATNPSTVMMPVTLTATVSGAFGGTPTGTVTLKAGAHTLGMATLSNGVGSIAYAFPNAGTTSITATYSGDSNFVGGTSPALIQVVKKAVTTGSVVSSLNPAIVGEQVTFTATFNSSIGPPADGEPVTFKDGAVTLATAKIKSGSAYFLTIKLSRGLHNIEAQYAGDAQRWAQTAGIVQEMKQR
ncbi:MAG: Ig-like domain-containing protein, partial [Candidatus Sulfotelmatobacter sp.]